MQPRIRPVLDQVVDFRRERQIETERETETEAGTHRERERETETERQRDRGIPGSEARRSAAVSDAGECRRSTFSPFRSLSAAG